MALTPALVPVGLLQPKDRLVDRPMGRPVVWGLPAALAGGAARSLTWSSAATHAPLLPC